MRKKSAEPKLKYFVKSHEIVDLAAEKMPWPFGDLFNQYYNHSSGKILKLVLDDCLPHSLNSQYIKRSRSVYDLHPDVKALRDVVRTYLGWRAKAWKPTGHTACILLMYSPLWVTQKGSVRQLDLDNKLKGPLDAIQNATGVPDELHWHIHCAKVWSNKTRLIVYMFDLGDVVEFYKR